VGLAAGQAVAGVVQRWTVSMYGPGSEAGDWAHDPACRASISPHALVLTGVSPKNRACSAWTLAVLTYWVHRYAQLGCGALVASIQVSPQPVAPSLGIVSATGAPAALS